MNELKQFFHFFKKGFSRFGHNIVLIINSILLSFVYIIGVGFTSILSKIVGKKFLSMEISKKKKSYWENLNLTKRPKNDYYRQF